MFFSSQLFTLLKLHSHPTQCQTLCIKHISICDIRIRVFLQLAHLQLVHRPVRGIPVRQEGRRTTV